MSEQWRLFPAGTALSHFFLHRLSVMPFPGASKLKGRGTPGPAIAKRTCRGTIGESSGFDAGVSEICIQISDDRISVARTGAAWLPGSPEALQFSSRNEPAAQNDSRYAASVSDVCQRVCLEQHQT